MADREPFRDREENRREDSKTGEERRGADRRSNDSGEGPRRGFSAPRGAGSGDRRKPESGDGPRYVQNRSDGGSGRPTREGGGQRREGGFSREGGGQRGRDDRNERGPRKDTGGAGRGADSGRRTNWQDRDGQRGERRPSRDQDSRNTGDGPRRWDRPTGGDNRSREAGTERRSYREGGSGGYSGGKESRPGSSSGRDGSSRGGDRGQRRSFGDDRRPSRTYGDAPRGGDRREAEYGRRPERTPRETGPDDAPFERPHNARDLRSANRPDRERSPEIDEDVTGSELDKITRAEIRNLEERSALWVAKHLVMAGRLIDDEPELAFQHALAASRRGGRLAVVREAVGLTAYAAGHYGEALREFRTYRRINGSNVHLPVMADCERGLGRPDRALDLARSEDASSLDAAGKVELAMVVSGARTDLGQLDAAVAALEIPQLTKNRAFSYSPRLFRAYADALAAVGRREEAASWHRQAEIAENALGVGAFEDPDIIDLVGDEEGADLDYSAARGTVQSVSSAPTEDASDSEELNNGEEQRDSE
ncbi:hypothetical protein GCM10027404_27400 [Arthrobacter tumbae]|uniref:hypothetical protein n=1 Tax=Arthrobacter tumbae TaxID=163874 RepID=UPI001EF850D3|nr:hypothetical protein [Arthrobacter tumbae]MBM7782796.1 tetratricopeptide (TPR) repeat protein [Arthrobacter tumbae]